ncbi:MAG TPA: hypothetical protein PLD15_06170 [Mesotoga sp.]|nr:hypothetical protein [Mesotoga sp.]
MSVAEIPLEELYTDRLESLADIGRLQVALGMGLQVDQQGNPYQTRLDTNVRIVRMIELELVRRQGYEATKAQLGDGPMAGMKLPPPSEDLMAKIAQAVSGITRELVEESFVTGGRSTKYGAD